MSLVYFGTSDFAAEVLTDLVSGGHPPTLVISRPDAPKGRGRKLTPPPVARVARDLGIELLQPGELTDPAFLSRLDGLGSPSAVLCAYGALVKEPLLSRLCILNLHPSLLPRWRGAAPIERAIMNGDKRTGVSVMRLVEELDAGPVCLSEEVMIESEDDYQSLAARLRTVGSRLVCRALDQEADGSLKFTAQRGEGVTYAERIVASDRLLDPSRPAPELSRVVRALTPHIGARLILRDGQGLGVRRAHARRSGPAEGKLEEEGGELLLGCREGALCIERVVPAGGREMSAADWLRGATGLL